jgi:hypothetical protein
MYRQGDLLLREVRELGNNVVKLTTNVIIRSPVTGHTHSITEGVVWRKKSVWRDLVAFYVQIPSTGAQLIHPEHASIDLPGGLYEIRRQREVTGFVED